MRKASLQFARFASLGLLFLFVCGIPTFANDALRPPSFEPSRIWLKGGPNVIEPRVRGSGMCVSEATSVATAVYRHSYASPSWIATGQSQPCGFPLAGVRYARAETLVVSFTSAAFLGRPERCSPEAIERAREAGRMPLPYLPTRAEEPLYLRVKGVRFAIPANYFRYPAIGCDVEEDGFLLRVLLPDLAPYDGTNKARLDGVPGEGWDGMNVLLTREFIPDMERLLSIAILAKVEGEVEADLEPWNGLSRTRDLWGNDVYFARDEEGDVSLILECGTQETARYPHCEQYSLYEGMVLKLGYSRRHLENWRSIQTKVERMLDGFRAPLGEGVDGVIQSGEGELR